MTTGFTTLISAAELAALLAREPKPVVIDTSFDLADTESGEKRFRASHLPGSHYLHLDRDLSGTKNGRNGRHPLPARADFARTVAALGIGPDTQRCRPRRARRRLRGAPVVDAALARPPQRRRPRRRHLGLAARRRCPDRPGFARAGSGAGALPDRPSLAPSVDAGGVATRPPRRAVLDARSGERFRGEAEPIDPVAGHIPGALNRFHRENLGDGGVFKAPDRLRQEFGAFLGDRSPDEVIHSCGSGVTACHNLLAMEYAGLSGSLLYPGSWSEWSADPARPIARG